jgi:hypothetical protein
MERLEAVAEQVARADPAVLLVLTKFQLSVVHLHSTMAEQEVVMEAVAAGLYLTMVQNKAEAVAGEQFK